MYRLATVYTFSRTDGPMMTIAFTQNYP